MTNPKKHYIKKRLKDADVMTLISQDEDGNVILTEEEVEDLFSRDKKFIPEYQSKLRRSIVEVPEEVYEASGIRIFGKRIKSFLFTTDLAVIRNSNADAVIAVYPFTPQQSIMESIIHVSSMPTVMGVGGGTTTGKRSIELAFTAEQLGAFGVVVNTPMPPSVIKEMEALIDVPIITTVVSPNDDYQSKLEAGASMLNVSAADKTALTVRKIRQEIGDKVPIIATGGPTGESIKETIEAGANAITYTPPTTAKIFASIMSEYRQQR
ncbi:hydrolase [Hutsoniella sourekii]